MVQVTPSLLSISQSSSFGSACSSNDTATHDMKKKKSHNNKNESIRLAWMGVVVYVCGYLHGMHHSSSSLLHYYCDNDCASTTAAATTRTSSSSIMIHQKQLMTATTTAAAAATIFANDNYDDDDNNIDNNNNNIRSNNNNNENNNDHVDNGTTKMYDDGWRSIQIYYGKEQYTTATASNHHRMDDYNNNNPDNTNNNKEQQQQQQQEGTKEEEQQRNNELLWFSQARQDEAIVTLLGGKRNGYFVDLAANDAIHLSNTYALETQFGWKGLCIEPNPVYWYNLTKHRTCEVIAAVVGGQQQEQEQEQKEKPSEPVYFRYGAMDHGGIVGSGFDNGKRWKKQSTKVSTVPLADILERRRTTTTMNSHRRHHDDNHSSDNNATTTTTTVIDYLSLDVEGAETFVLLGFPFDKYEIKTMTVERPKPELRKYLEQNGFQMIQRLTKWGETLWAHRSVLETIDLHAYLERMEFPIPKQ